MKKAISGFITVLSLLAVLLPGKAYAMPENSASSIILIHEDTGQVLYEKNADERMLIASTTKIMTALVVLDKCSPDETVKILPEYTKVEGSSMYLKSGETYTVCDLLYGMLLVSGNDAATALACHCGGSIAGFAAMMNNKAREMGLCNSNFKNPHGLDEKGHYSSAADLAAITREAMKNKLFAKIVSTKTYTVGNQALLNHNKMLWNFSGCTGVKTGYTIAAGRSLVTCAERNGLKLICVTLSDPNDWADHAALYDWAFDRFAYKAVFPMGVLCELPVISGTGASVGIKVASDSRILVRKDADMDFTIELPEFVYAGIRAGDCAGRVFISADGEQVGEFPLVYSENVPLADNARMSPWDRFRKAWFMVNKYGFLLQNSD